MHVLVHFMVSHKSLSLCSFFFIVLFVDWVISVDLFSSSLIVFCLLQYAVEPLQWIFEFSYCTFYLVFLYIYVIYLHLLIQSALHICRFRFHIQGWKMFFLMLCCCWCVCYVVRPIMVACVLNIHIFFLLLIPKQYNNY